MLQDERTTPYTTKCVLKYLENGEGFYKGAAKIASSLRFLSCRHGKGTKAPNECILLAVADGNPDFLCVGAQDLALREKIRDIPNAPLLFVRGNVPVSFGFFFVLFCFPCFCFSPNVETIFFAFFCPFCLRFVL